VQRSSDRLPDRARPESWSKEQRQGHRQPASTGEVHHTHCAGTVRTRPPLVRIHLCVIRDVSERRRLYISNAIGWWKRNVEETAKRPAAGGALGTCVADTPPPPLPYAGRDGSPHLPAEPRATAPPRSPAMSTPARRRLIRDFKKLQGVSLFCGRAAPCLRRATRVSSRLGVCRAPTAFVANRSCACACLSCALPLREGPAHRHQRRTV
jgi:hypothetical protein